MDEHDDYILSFGKNLLLLLDVPILADTNKKAALQQAATS
jgi:hypothetical protein